MTDKQLKVLLQNYKRQLDKAIEEWQKDNPDSSEAHNMVGIKHWPTLESFREISRQIKEDIESLK